MFIADENQTFLLQGFLQAQESKVRQYSSADLLSLLLGDLLSGLHPFNLNSMAFLHTLFNSLLLEQIIDLGPIVSRLLLVIDFRFHCHTDTFFNDGVKKDKKLVTGQGCVLQ